MGKLPKSTRVERRNPSKTFNHPYQLNVFDPPLASSLREIGYVAKTLIPIYAGLIYGYTSSAQHLGDDAPLKERLLGQSRILAGILACTIAIEVLRSVKADKWLSSGVRDEVLIGSDISTTEAQTRGFSHHIICTGYIRYADERGNVRETGFYRTYSTANSTWSRQEGAVGEYSY